jgi:hypothetical protein
MNKKELILWGFMSCLTFYLSVILFVASHEAAHKQIYAYHGIDSEVTYNRFYLTGVTTPINDSLKGGFFIPELWLAHDLNDVVGKALELFIVFFNILIALISYILIDRR